MSGRRPEQASDKPDPNELLWKPGWLTPVPRYIAETMFPARVMEGATVWTEPDR